MSFKQGLARERTVLGTGNETILSRPLLSTGASVKNEQQELGNLKTAFQRGKDSWFSAR